MGRCWGKQEGSGEGVGEGRWEGICATRRIGFEDTFCQGAACLAHPVCPVRLLTWNQGPAHLTGPPPPPPLPGPLPFSPRLLTCSPMQALVSNAFLADQHMHTSAWLGKLTHVPGPRGTALQQSLLTCIAHAASSPTTGQGSGAGQGHWAVQRWRLVSRPIIAFAVALLEKGNVKAAELADALSGTSMSTAVNGNVN